MNEKLIIRLSHNGLSFTVVCPSNAESPVSYEAYDVKNGISMAANMREAFRTVSLLGEEYQRIQVLVDAPVLMVPVDLYQEQQKETLYFHSFPQATSANDVLANVLPDLNCVALYSVNRDLKMVIDDHFPGQAQFLCATIPVWHHLHQRSFTGIRNKLYGYFHDQRLDVFSFQQNRFKFCNSFDAQRRADSLYFLLYVWKQLNLQPEHDELHLVGAIPEAEELLKELRQYLKRAYIINPSADFNRSSVTQIEGMPYDLMTFIVKGR